ncbi:MAG: 3-deoxy-manno-octulosonate cytidylyltransferase [Desulfobacteraceae bacterium]|nr:3-deoxy-manno-octulosonate cytidylyltransferase [Desulfobacteraceae bacterium]
MHIYGIIPAHYASTRLPGKVLADICGKPMIRHVYDRALCCSRLDKLYVATDDERIAEVVTGFGGACVMTRADHESGTDRLAEAAESLCMTDGDVIVNIQGDEPLLEPAMLDILVDAVLAPPRPDMATLAFSSANRVEFQDPNVVKAVVDRNCRALYFSRAPVPFPRDADGEPAFLKHLGFYAYQKSFLTSFTALPPGKLERIEKLEQLRALENGYSIRVAISPFDSESVDTPEDLRRVISLVAARNC